MYLATNSQDQWKIKIIFPFSTLSILLLITYIFISLTNILLINKHNKTLYAIQHYFILFNLTLEVSHNFCLKHKQNYVSYSALTNELSISTKYVHKCYPIHNLNYVSNYALAKKLCNSIKVIEK